jgi:hypothetical protein
VQAHYVYLRRFNRNRCASFTRQGIQASSTFTGALKHFAGQEVNSGFRMDDPPPKGFGFWVQEQSAPQFPEN